MIDNEIEEANQSDVVQYFEEMILEKDLIGILVEYVIAYETLFHLVKHADVINVEYCEQMQRETLG